MRYLVDASVVAEFLITGPYTHIPHFCVIFRAFYARP